ncbi:MAG TPA: TIGR01777 family oxidoreductase [Nocardioidaceae bacterium]|nr:TIGR01777 family oxidoreductase [Nocardioidaceae bacterium]
MRYVIAGSSGFLGTALRARLARDGHDVTRLVRRPAGSASESSWDPYAGAVDADLIASADVVVNLAGVSLAHWPWTEDYRRKILDSRLSTTGTLATAIAAAPKPPAFIVASGVARYGTDRGNEILTEDSSDGHGFLPDVVRQWEAAADPARAAGGRVCHLRTGVVIHRGGGALKFMRPPFWLGIGGRVGSGAQYFPIISLPDWLSVVVFLAEHPDCVGPYNLVSPVPTTNLEFTRALASALHRPAIMRAPAVAMRTALGEVADELVGSRRILPQRLITAGFKHEHHEVDAIVDNGLHR